MAALDDILGNGTASTGLKPKPVKVAAPPVDSRMDGAPGTVGSQPAATTGGNAEDRTEGTVGEQSRGPGPRMVDASLGNVEAKGVESPLAGISGGAESVGGGMKPGERLSYRRMYELMNGDNAPETPEERAAREKREKSEAILSAVGDGISALSNLFFTTRYAPNAYDASKGMSARARERWDRLRQEREARRREYTEGYMRAAAMDDANDRDDRNWRHTLERERIADERYEVKAAQDKAMADLDEQLRRHQITAAEHKAEQERIKAQFAGEYEQSKVDRNRAAAGASKASAASSYSRARYYDNGGIRGGKSKSTLRLEDGIHTYSSKEDYEKEVEKYAKEYGVKLYEAYRDGTENDRKGTPKYTTKRKSTAQVAAEIEREVEKRKKSKDEFSQYEVGKDEYSQYEKK